MSFKDSRCDREIHSPQHLGLHTPKVRAERGFGSKFLIFPHCQCLWHMSG